MDDYNCQAAQGLLLEKGDVDREAWQERALLGNNLASKCVFNQNFSVTIFR